MPVLEFEFPSNLKDHIYKLYTILFLPLNICELFGYNKNTTKDSNYYFTNLKMILHRYY